MFKILITLIFVLSFQSNIHAQSVKIGPLNNNSNVPELNQWDVDLGFDIGYSTIKGLAGNISPSFQYYFLSNLSLGGSIDAYFSRNVRVYSLGPSGTFYMFTKGPYRFIFNQKIQFRNYDKPRGINVSKSISVSSLAADYSVDRDISLRLGVSYKKTLDGEPLYHNNKDGTDEDWVIPTFGFSYNL